jgi:uncharacterized membrane protein YjjP (DUF1212 family)
MDFKSIVSTVFSGGGGIISQIKDLAGAFITTPQEKLEFEAKLNDMAHKQTVELIDAHNAEVANARDLQKAALQQDDKLPKRFIYYFAWFWSGIAAMFIAAVLFVEIPPANTRFADTILGFLLGTIIASIINYFFGSSSGSASKNELLHKIKG